MSWDAELRLAREAALRAGDLLTRLRAGQLDVDSDAGRDIKLAADRQAEAAILDTLAASPHPILAEESGVSGAATDGPRWIVDPLDGTVNYSRGLDLCCVSIALWDGERPLCGVVHDFTRRELFCGVVGRGAWRNDAPIQVSAAADPARAILGTGFPVNRDFASPALHRFIDRVRSFKKLRLLGSAALSLAWVACGRLDAYCEEDIMLWDVAAGLALVAAAGGRAEATPSPARPMAHLARAAATAGLFAAISAKD
ncbi:inositol monophosphatase family protein [Solidesulfovibrio sp.]|uniref:inositol monophosphatase family protein n=1 Tax=Solidesulfovibrio sp. TaxID=2910990 RepID=UPI002B20681A|nr:inositol monophosphatase family protein [Solidesulfovibrio sp.]MEA4855584.1 inositol monophosphatase family protein [Solidesulfovibrio sp.]